MIAATSTSGPDGSVWISAPGAAEASDTLQVASDGSAIIIRSDEAGETLTVSPQAFTHLIDGAKVGAFDKLTVDGPTPYVWVRSSYSSGKGPTMQFAYDPELDLVLLRRSDAARIVMTFPREEWEDVCNGIGAGQLQFGK